ncbi:MAG TPA: thioester reductase domain-containing protein, partial [Rhizomicrobium sp.]
MSAPRIAAISPAKQELLLRMLRARREAPQPPAAMTVEQMLAEAVLPADIDPAMAAPPSAAPATFLLTGATGFIGAYLLDALRTRNRAPIYCLVRAADAAEAKARLAANLAVYGLAPPDDNVVAAPGDLAAPRLGLDAAAFERLAGETDAILHCGALVKWTYPYAALRGANVEGTLEVLRLATRGRLKPVHFISTVGVFSSGEHRGGAVLETTPLEDSGSLAVGYAQSKWIAEKLVRLAGARGLPVAIYRPNTGPDSRSGAFNTSDYISQI